MTITWVHRKQEKWPLVLPNDNGIRPAGGSNECFYCHALIGSPHQWECCTVLALVRYDVSSDGVKVGTYDAYDPQHWSVDQGEFHKNDGTWCCDNALDDIKWFDTTFAQQVKERLNSLDENDCSCRYLDFRYDSTVDEGPFIIEQVEEQTR